MNGARIGTILVATLILITNAPAAVAQMKPSALVRSKRIQSLPIDGAPQIAAGQNKIVVEAVPYMFVGGLIGFAGGFVYAKATPGQGLYKLNDIFVGMGVGMVGGATVFIIKKVLE